MAVNFKPLIQQHKQLSPPNALRGYCPAALVFAHRFFAAAAIFLRAAAESLRRPRRPFIERVHPCSPYSSAPCALKGCNGLIQAVSLRRGPAIERVGHSDF